MVLSRISYIIFNDLIRFNFLISLRTMSKVKYIHLRDKHDCIIDFSDATASQLQKKPNILNGTLHDNIKDMTAVLEVSCRSLQEDNIIAVPTDTIYGIAGLAQSNEAVSKIYKIKGRDGGKPVSICVGNIQQIYRWGKVTVPNAVLKDLLPGPVTVVFERTDALNPDLNPGTELVGIRVPDHEFIQKLADECDSPLALTSANISKEKSTLSTQEFSHIWEHLDVIVDGGTLGNTEQARSGSTVVDLSQNGTFRIIRPGCSLQSTTKILLKHGLSQTIDLISSTTT